MAYSSTLVGDVSSSDTSLYVAVAPTVPYPPYLTIDSEVVALLSVNPSFTITPHPAPRAHISVQRGALGTTRATHSDGATVSGGSGSSSVSVDNGTDPPAPVTTINASTWAVDGSTATPPWQGPDGTLNVDLPIEVSTAALRITVDETEVFSVNPTGQINVTTGPTVVGEDLVTGLAYVLKGQVPADQTAQRFKIAGDDPAGSEFTIGAAGGLQIVPRADVVRALDVFDSGGNRVFSVNADGTVHIKTGTSVVADL